MSTSEAPGDHDASLVHPTGARAYRSPPEVLGSPRAEPGCRYQRIVAEARAEGKSRTPDTEALASAAVSDVLAGREFGEGTENAHATGDAYAITMEVFG